MFFCGRSSGKNMMSLRMQFEKRDVGYCRKLSGMRGSALLAERERFKLYTIRGHSLMTSHTKVRVVGSFEMVYSKSEQTLPYEYLQNSSPNCIKNPQIEPIGAHS